MERCLDLGIGKGGEYLLNPNCRYIGLDLNFIALKFAQASYPDISYILADASARKVGLPFGDNSFWKVLSLFPNNTLLYAFTKLPPKANLWVELRRILKPGGILEIFVDVPIYGEQGVYVDNEYEMIIGPHYRIYNCAESSGFKIIDFRELSLEELEQLKTYFSSFNLQRINSFNFFSASIWKISAAKNS